MSLHIGKTEPKLFSPTRSVPPFPRDRFEEAHRHPSVLSRKDRTKNEWYFTLTQAIDFENIQDRDGSPLRITMLPSFPDESPSKAGPETVETLTTESASALRPSRIRCKMCRHDLATRERLLHLVALSRYHLLILRDL
jgi:hypothetical protein